MFSCVSSGGIRGIGGYLVKVETDISPGMPMFELVGYLGSEVREAGQRVRTALKNTGYDIPLARITVNLAPADIRKQGTGYDLPIALSVLSCMGVVGVEALNDTFIAGELMLSGKICGIKGILPMILEAKRNGFRKCIIPKDNRNEGVMVDGIHVIGVDSLEQVIKYVNGEENLEAYKSNLKDELCKPDKYKMDLKNVRGQLLARRGIEIGASGLHNVLMKGAPGAGKSMLAKCIPSVFPPMSEEECLEVSSIYSVKGSLLEEGGIITRRPFVAVHNTATEISMIGGGNVPKPGAVSMAHNGVLFLDELPEFSRRTLEALRQPLEDRMVNITRNKDICTFPANFMLVAAMNPCPCGYYPDRNKCTCTESARRKYMAKISGPLMDRIDICVTTEKVAASALATPVEAESSETVRKRVIKAHQIQKDRFANTHITFNSQMSNEEIDKYCTLTPSAKSLITAMADKYEMSARTYYRVIRISRTIADLSENELIGEPHVAEAIRYKLSMVE